MSTLEFLPLRRRETLEGKQNAAREVLSDGVRMGPSQQAEGIFSYGLSPACAHYLDIALSEKVVTLHHSIYPLCARAPRIVLTQLTKNKLGRGTECLGEQARQAHHQHHHPRQAPRDVSPRGEAPDADTGGLRGRGPAAVGGCR